MNKKYLTPLQIEFLHWLKDHVSAKSNMEDAIWIIKNLLNTGWYLDTDSKDLNDIVKMYKQKWLERKTGPVQHKR